MVRIRIKLFLFCILMGMLLANAVFAARQALEFTDVSVKVGGRTSKDLVNGETIDEDAKPGDNLEFRVKVKNNFTDEEDLEIRDVRVKAIVEGIDDGSDLEDETSDLDLDPGEERRVTIKFDVPWEVDDDTFNALIEVDGDDKNGTNQRVEMKLKLDVNKESHLLKITKKTLTPQEVSCNRKNVQFGIFVINIGTEDEEEATVSITNPNIGVGIKDTIKDLTAEPNQEESRFSRSYSFNVPDTLEAASYPITLSVLYNDEKKKLEDVLNLDVNDCQSKKTGSEAGAKSAQASAEEQKFDEIIVNQPKGGEQVQQESSALQQNTVVTQESFLKSNSFITLIIAAEIIAVIMGVALIIYLFSKK